MNNVHTLKKSLHSKSSCVATYSYAFASSYTRGWQKQMGKIMMTEPIKRVLKHQTVMYHKSNTAYSLFVKLF